MRGPPDLDGLQHLIMVKEAIMDLKRAKPILFLMVLLAASLACETITRLGSAGSPPLIKDDFSDSHSGWGQAPMIALPSST